MAKLDDRQFQRLASAVEDEGRRYGAGRGSWVIDGNTDDATVERLVKGMEEGDPEIADELPTLNLGEWADDPTENDIIAAAAFNAGIDLDPRELEGEETSELLESFSSGWYEGVHNEVYRDARLRLGPKKMRELTQH